MAHTLIDVEVTFSFICIITVIWWPCYWRRLMALVRSRSIYALGHTLVLILLKIMCLLRKSCIYTCQQFAASLYCDDHGLYAIFSSRVSHDIFLIFYHLLLQSELMTDLFNSSCDGSSWLVVNFWICILEIVCNDTKGKIAAYICHWVVMFEERKDTIQGTFGFVNVVSYNFFQLVPCPPLNQVIFSFIDIPFPTAVNWLCCCC